MLISYLYHKLKQPTRQSASVNAPTASSCQHGSTGPKCELCVAEKRAARKYRWKLLCCLLPAFFTASLDLTIVATALPFIASHFDKFNQLNWIVTAFTLTSTAFIPVFGQLADTFGRHSGIQLAVSILTIGSALCAAAPDWPVLLLGRALQGIGTAGVQNISMIILADSVSLKEQAVNTSIFQLMNGVGYSVGPVIGGYLTNANWRYCFVLSVGTAALTIPTIFLLRKDLKPGSVSLSHPSGGQRRVQALRSGLVSLDFGGILLFTAGVALIILGTAWGGSTFPWSSAGVITSLVIGSVLLVCFAVYESSFEPGRYLSRRLPKTIPMIPFTLLRNKDVGLVCLIAAATGTALYSVFYFIGIYFTLVEAYPASKAGTQLLYYVPGLGIGVYAAIFLCNVWPRQTFWPLFLGTVVETGGIAALTYAVRSRHHTLVNIMMIVAGAGTGARFMPSNLHLAGMFRDQLAPVYSILRFSLPFGGTLALTIMGAVFQNQMAVYFGDLGSDNSTGFSLHNQAALEAINQLPQAQQDVVRSRGATATMWSFVSILPFLCLSVLTSLGLGNVWISKKGKAESSAGATTAAPAVLSNTSHETNQSQEIDVAGSRQDEKHEHPEQTTGLSDTGRRIETVEGAQAQVIRSIYLLALIKGTTRSIQAVAE